MERASGADPRIDAYIAGAPDFARPILHAVRSRVHDVIPAVEETFKGGMPAFLVDGKLLLGMAAFKTHASVSFWRGSEMGLDRTAGGMGQLGRLTSVDDLPDPLEFERLLRSAANLIAKAPESRPAKPAKPPLDPHPDLVAALDSNPAAKAVFDAFAPSHRRDYVEWVNDAKRGETRVKRIAQAVEWLAQGKKRNWKHENR